MNCSMPVFGFSARRARRREDRFRALVKTHHPDQGGDRDTFERIVQAREAARIEIA
jgi:hypothetical protein